MPLIACCIDECLQGVQGDYPLCGRHSDTIGNRITCLRIITGTAMTNAQLKTIVNYVHHTQNPRGHAGRWVPSQWELAVQYVQQNAVPNY